jgi:hypothetical protein
MSKTPHPQSAEADFPPLHMERGPGGEAEKSFKLLII